MGISPSFHIPFPPFVLHSTVLLISLAYRERSRQIAVGWVLGDKKGYSKAVSYEERGVVLHPPTSVKSFAASFASESTGLRGNYCNFAIDLSKTLLSRSLAGRQNDAGTRLDSTRLDSHDESREN